MFAQSNESQIQVFDCELFCTFFLLKPPSILNQVRRRKDRRVEESGRQRKARHAPASRREERQGKSAVKTYLPVSLFSLLRPSASSPASSPASLPNSIMKKMHNSVLSFSCRDGEETKE